MLKKIAAALVAATVLAAPVLIAGTSAVPAATTQTAKVVKPGIKAVKKHRKHVRKHAYGVRHGIRYVKVMRHGKTEFVKTKAARHHASHIKKPLRPGTKVSKPRAA